MNSARWRLTVALVKRTPILLWVLLLVMGLVTAFSASIDDREAQEALSDFAQLQVKLADGIGAGLEAVPAAQRGDDRLLESLRRVERPDRRVVYLHWASANDFVRPSGEHVQNEVLRAACDSNATMVKLSHDESVSVGLPPRTSWAGLSRLGDGSVVIAIGSGYRESDRGKHAYQRLWLTVGTDSLLLLLCGLLVVRNQRHNLELEHARKLAEATSVRDEKLARVSRAGMLGTLAMGVAHEISTPLGIISQRAEQLLGQDDGQVQETAAAIAQQTARINGSIRSFLGLVRGHPPLLQPLAAKALVDSACSLVEHTFANARVSLRVDCEQAGLTVRGDARLLETALVNLLINARQACSADGFVTVEVSRQGQRLVIVVRDNGAGIAREIVARASEPFLTTKPPGEGTGLGLAIVKEIVHHHRGEFVIAPVAPRGTVATMTLPLEGEPRA